MSRICFFCHPMLAKGKFERKKLNNNRVIPNLFNFVQFALLGSESN